MVYIFVLLYLFIGLITILIKKNHINCLIWIILNPYNKRKAALIKALLLIFFPICWLMK